MANDEILTNEETNDETGDNILTHVKAALGITGTFQDDTLTEYINEVIEYVKAAGVSENVINGGLANGLITRGVSDLWNYGSGGTKLSNYFIQRLLQLKADKGGEG